ncbi:MAG: hypothetical protein LWW99_08000 [Deltaproteobacteria bacterium]|nr:hypothetical protein [Deltaproteobacteria bacterium]
MKRPFMVEEGVWEQAGDLDASLRRKGITIPPMDILIAQTCRRHDVSLFALDEHFSSVPGLRLFQGEYSKLVPKL